MDVQIQPLKWRSAKNHDLVPFLFNSRLRCSSRPSSLEDLDVFLGLQLMWVDRMKVDGTYSLTVR